MPWETPSSVMGGSSAVMVELRTVDSSMGKSKVGLDAGIDGGQEKAAIAKMGEALRWVRRAGSLPRMEYEARGVCMYPYIHHNLSPNHSDRLI